MTDPGTLLVSVTAQQRLALGVGSEVSYFTGSHSFVPGSVLRGALAAAWIAEHGPPAGNPREAHFRALFDGNLRYGPLHVLGSVVVPVSAWTCKYPKKNKGCEGVAADIAFEDVGKCPACGGPMEQGKGQVLLPPGVALDRITRTSINPATGTAKNGELYAHGALPAGTQLAGTIHGRDDWLQAPRQLRFGGRRTVGGAVSYTAVPVPAEQEPPSWDGTGPLTVRLTSPGVFVDLAGRPRLDPDPRLDLGGAVVERKWARPVTWSGWHAASALPKPEEVCAVAGSTYRLAGPPALLGDLAQRLPREGAGLRRGEGFGEMQVVTSAWRPPARVRARPAPEDARALQLRADVQNLDLSPQQRRWVIAALADLQLEQERHAAGLAAAGTAAGPAVTGLADSLLTRPAADSFSGRQRDALRTLFTEADPGLLRDLIVLLRSGQAAQAGGDENR